jgi:hypothetical protein
MLRKLVYSAALAATTLSVLGVWSSSADALVVTSSRGDFKIDVLEGTFDSLETELVNQPFFGDRSFAFELASLVGGDLGLPNSYPFVGLVPFLPRGPIFAYDTPDAFIFGWNSLGNPSAVGDPIGNSAPNTSYVYATATSVTPPQPVPEGNTMPMLVFLPGLVGISVAIWRRQHNHQSLPQ